MQILKNDINYNKNYVDLSVTIQAENRDKFGWLIHYPNNRI